MNKEAEKVDPYGELIHLAGELAQALAMMQMVFATTGALPAKERKEFSRAVALALRIKTKTLALAKARGKPKGSV